MMAQRSIEDRKNALARNGITPAERECWMGDPDYVDALDYQIAHLQDEAGAIAELVA